jgi:hypothetical protein
LRKAAASLRRFRGVAIHKKISLDGYTQLPLFWLAKGLCWFIISSTNEAAKINKK